MGDKRGTNLSTRVAAWLLYLSAAIWLVLAVFTLAHLALSPGGDVTTLVVGVLMFANAAAMVLAARGIVTGWGLVHGRRLFRYFVLAVLSMNILLTFTDQFGTADLLTLLLDVLIVVLLIVGWRTPQ